MKDILILGASLFGYLQKLLQYISFIFESHIEKDTTKLIKLNNLILQYEKISKHSIIHGIPSFWTIENKGYKQ